MKIHAIISGPAVHDVGYRVFLLNKALKSGLTGFSAFNKKSTEDNQQIEIFADGDTDAIEDFSKEMQENVPSHAIVNDILIEPYNRRVISIQDYMHLVQVEQLDKGIPAILSIKSSQEQMLQKQDQMLVKQDQMLVKQDQMIVKQDQMIDKQDQTVKEIQTLRYYIKTEINERFNKIEHDLEQVKDALHKHGINA